MKKEILPGRDVSFHYKRLPKEIEVCQYSWLENETMNPEEIINLGINYHHLYIGGMQFCDYPLDVWTKKKGMWMNPAVKKYIVNDHFIEAFTDLGRFAAYYGTAEIDKGKMPDIIRNIFHHPCQCAILMCDNEIELSTLPDYFAINNAKKDIMIDYNVLISWAYKQGIVVLIPQIYTDENTYMAEYVIDIFNKK